MEATKVPTNRWIVKDDVAYIYIHTRGGILLSYKKEWNFAIYSNMNGTGRHYAKWNKSEKDKYCVISLICEA